MGMRRVLLDEETEKALDQVIQRTGWSASAVLKRSVLTLQNNVGHISRKSPFEIYCSLDLGPGGYACTPSTETRRSIQKKLREN